MSTFLLCMTISCIRIRTIIFYLRLQTLISYIIQSIIIRMNRMNRQQILIILALFIQIQKYILYGFPLKWFFYEKLLDLS